MHRESSLASNGLKVDEGSKPMTAFPEKKKRLHRSLKRQIRFLKTYLGSRPFPCKVRDRHSHMKVELLIRMY